MKAFYIVHGFVQGVGFRAHVRSVANKYGIKGMVKNVGNGAVEILADANEEALEKFEKEINVKSGYGPEVLKIEKYHESDDAFPKNIKEYEKFVIE